MKLATRQTSDRDGLLLVVSRDLERAAPATGIAATLQDALERWDDVRGRLEALYERINSGAVPGEPLAALTLAAPLPRAWQWLDASAFPAHGALMQRAFDLPPIDAEFPLMYQGMSHRFFGPRDDVPFPTEDDDIDFEGEFGVIVGDVPMGTPAERALDYVRLAVQINDWSLRRIAPVEMRTGFGWIQAKPACSVAPIAVTPDELGSSWSNGRVTATLEVRRNGELFGSVPATEMGYGFHELIEHAARTRALCAGTLIGSGTISSSNHREFGFCCITERRAAETIELGAPTTPFLRYDEIVEMRAFDGGSALPLFGEMRHRVVRAEERGTAGAPD